MISPSSLDLVVFSYTLLSFSREKRHAHVPLLEIADYSAFSNDETTSAVAFHYNCVLGVHHLASFGYYRSTRW
ncbi:unnamed protein product, partial [Vitis vinifera]|uniref:Uncharacterized protein n=1 Tax=Vitis vinifera TaxID=29760 RepID=D7THL5_VITVI